MGRGKIEQEMNEILLEIISKEYDDFLEKLSLKSPGEIIRA